MRWLRSTWRLRAVTLLLVAGLLPLTVVWPKQTALQRTIEPHADWLRTQVSVKLDDTGRDAFESALETAAEANTRSLEEFLRRFVAAYAQRTAGPSLAQLFGLSEGARAQILDALQRRIVQVAGWAAVPRLSTAQQSISSPSSHRSVDDATLLTLPHAAVVTCRAVVADGGSRLGEALLRVLSASRPRAP